LSLAGSSRGARRTNGAGTGTGIYRHHRQWGAAELLRAGTFREEAARIAASQRYAGDAHVNLYYRVSGL
jgi:hypothetical protein